MQDSTREKIRQIQATRSQRIAAIRKDESLSEVGKKRAIAQVEVAVRPQIDALREKDARETQDQQIGLETKLFGIGSLADSAYVIAFRDACDRADKVKTPAEAMTLLSRAARTGDKGMTKAVFATAWRHAVGNQVEKPGTGWRQVIDTYLDEINPGAADDAVALDRLLAHQSSREARFVEAMEASVSPAAEVQGENVDKLAREQQERDAAGPTYGDDSNAGWANEALRYASNGADPKHTGAA